MREGKVNHRFLGTAGLIIGFRPVDPKACYPGTTEQVVNMADKSTGDDKIIDFDSAKQVHVLQRKEDRVQNMRQAFKAAREAGQPKPAKPNKPGKPGPGKGGRKK